MPYVTDYFLLENPFSNGKVTKRIQHNAISTRALVQSSILNEAYFVKATRLKRKPLVYRSLPVSPLEI